MYGIEWERVRDRAWDSRDAENVNERDDFETRDTYTFIHIKSVIETQSPKSMYKIEA